MLSPLIDDVAQRILTLNKLDQRDNLRRLLRDIGVASGARVLDYGCGTGLFATTLAENGARYVGYDLDERVVKYASRRYPSLTFTHAAETAARHGPYDYVVANCCFHHIPDTQASGALDFIRRSLGPDGRFVMIDLLAPSDTVTTSPLHHLYGLIERGASIRCDDDNVRLLEAQFDVVRAGVARTHLLSMRRSPLYTNLGMYVCRPRASATVMSVGDGLRLAHVKKSP